ncbi:hypothetical protein [Moraxella lacunata]|uniref:hypothetical protein n=1 Tax=Moraxella lacunata TaxID=477 RepID=UPI0026C08D39
MILMVATLLKKSFIAGGQFYFLYVRFYVNKLPLHPHHKPHRHPAHSQLDL